MNEKSVERVPPGDLLRPAFRRQGRSIDRICPCRECIQALLRARGARIEYTGFGHVPNKKMPIRKISWGLKTSHCCYRTTDSALPALKLPGRMAVWRSSWSSIVNQTFRQAMSPLPSRHRDRNPFPSPSRSRCPNRSPSQCRSRGRNHRCPKACCFRCALFSRLACEPCPEDTLANEAFGHGSRASTLNEKTRASHNAPGVSISRCTITTV
jgi:hypothetical protein